MEFSLYSSVGSFEIHVFEKNGGDDDNDDDISKKSVLIRLIWQSSTEWIKIGRGRKQDTK